MMLSVEDQIERLADVAFAQTSPVAWPQPSGDEDDERAPTSLQRRFVLAVEPPTGGCRVTSSAEPSVDLG